MSISSFPSEVHDSLQYYVYRLIDPRNGDTFYVGKGKGNRVFAHASGDICDDPESDKFSTIRNIQNAGLAVEHVIHRHGMDEKTAFEVEAALMDAYPGITNISGGLGNEERGSMHAVEIISRYAAEEAQFEHKALLITVNRTASQYSLYDATRQSWVLSVNEANKAEVILPVVRGMIVGAFVADRWFQSGAANDEDSQSATPARKTRYEFTGQEANVELMNKYKGKKVPASYRKKGASNPIRYSWK